MVANLPQSMQSPHFLWLHASHTLPSHPSHLLSCEWIPHMWHRACSAVKGAVLEPEPITAQLATVSSKGGAHCEVLVAAWKYHSLASCSKACQPSCKGRSHCEVLVSWW